MADVIGTIAACIDLAEKIANLVEKFAEAQKRIQTIASDVSLLQSILKQLKEVLRPDPIAGYTVVRLSHNGQHNTLTAAQRCQRIFTKIRDELSKTLYDKRFKAKLDHGEVIYVNSVVRLFWIFKESSISELREELNRSKQDVVLSLSVNLLSVAKQPVQLHPLDQRELDRLRATVELIWAEKQAVGASVKPFQPLPPSGGVSSAAVSTGPMGAKGLIAADAGNSDTPNYFCKNIYRVSRSVISPEVLDGKQIRWLNDPFEQNVITIYDELDEVEFRSLHELTLQRHKYRIPEGRVLQSASLIDDQKRRQETEVVRKGDERERRREEMELARMKDERRMKERKNEERKESLPSFDPSEDVVELLIKEWTLPSASVSDARTGKPGTYKKKQYLTDAELAEASKRSMKIRECSYRFQIGEWMYSCGTCGLEDEVVFCIDCFNSTDHVGHFTERRKAQSNEAYCDCGHSDSVTTTVHCNIHGTYDVKGPSY